MKTPTYKIGDLVTNQEPMIGTWYAMIYKVRPAKGAPDGFVYETLGFWDTSKSLTPTLRQLWASHLTPDTKEVVAGLRSYLA